MKIYRKKTLLYILFFFLFIILLNLGYFTDLFYFPSGNLRYLNPDDLFPYHKGEHIQFISDEGSTITLSILNENERRRHQYIEMIATDHKTKNFKKYKISILKNRINVLKENTFREYRSDTFFHTPSNFKITNKLRTGKKIKFRSGGQSFEICGYDRITLKSGESFLALRVEEQIYGTLTLWFQWWTPGLGLLRWERKELKGFSDQCGEKEWEIEKWEVVLDGVKTMDRLKRYNFLVESLSKQNLPKDPIKVPPLQELW